MSDDTVKIQLPDGRTSSARWDDFETVGEKPTENIVTADSAAQVHEMPETWLRSRVRGWMELRESPGLDFWIGTYTADGMNSRWIFCSSRQDNYVPLMHRVVYARDVCRYINRHCAYGGAWLTGWIRGGNEFYLLWKDPDGDIAIPLECDKPFVQILGWPMDVWAQHCNDAIKLRHDWLEAMELSKSQQVKLAQGQSMDTASHLAAAPEPTLPL